MNIWRSGSELPNHLKAVLTFGYYTGARAGEILGLQWGQVDLQSSHGASRTRKHEKRPTSNHSSDWRVAGRP